MLNYPNLDPAWQHGHATLLCRSYQRWTGKTLIDPQAGTDDTSTGDLFRQLFDARCIILSHGTEKDPVFNFGNRRALELFEYNWEQFTTLPSRLSAEPVNREERQQLLDRVTNHGFIDDYSGVRIAASGKRFFIDSAVVWNLLDDDNNYLGQAATFNQWRFL